MTRGILLAAALAATPVTATAQDVDLETGAALFADNCAACHGAEAHGDGPAAVGLSTQPADLTRIADRRDGVWPIFEVMSIIDGYTQATTPRDDMPILSALTEGPIIELTADNGLTTEVPANLLAVADYLESIQSPPPERYVP
ncbi:hypothetical protein A8B78_04125 [Jannaschia sp. EhC01]|nr:hypothetical protein A8B78_04125 [Jannaschia sp. EhC01]